MMYSHIAKPDELHPEWRCQSIDEHNEGVARLCSSFAQPFGFDSIGYIMGLLHDKGKEQEEWQKYLQSITGYNQEFAHVKSSPHHAYVGACIAQKQYPHIAPLIAQPIAGHHRGLYDYCDYVVEVRV